MFFKRLLCVSIRLGFKDENYLNYGFTLEKFIFQWGRQTSKNYRTVEQQLFEILWFMMLGECSRFIQGREGIFRLEVKGQGRRRDGGRVGIIVRYFGRIFIWFLFNIVGLLCLRGRVKRNEIGWGVFSVRCFGGCGRSKRYIVLCKIFNISFYRVFVLFLIVIVVL